MQLFLVRHADRSHVGVDGSPVADPPLNTLGRRQAEALATRLAGVGLTHV